MGRAPRLSSRELCKRIEALGARKLDSERGKGSHVMYERKRADDTIGRASVPTHGDVILPKTLSSILRALGLSREDL
jgi:predicted RNA binding protein YcfA (HicA-like mRNA interferase family)